MSTIGMIVLILLMSLTQCRSLSYDVILTIVSLASQYAIIVPIVQAFTIITNNNPPTNVITSPITLIKHYNQQKPRQESTMKITTSILLLATTQGNIGDSYSFLGTDFDDTDDDDYYDDEEETKFGNNWILPSSRKVVSNEDEDEDDEDDAVVIDYFYENCTSNNNNSMIKDEDSKNTIKESNIEYFDVGIDGIVMQTGPLSLKMYEGIASKLNSKTTISDPTILRTIYTIVLHSTIEQAVSVLIQQSGLQLAPSSSSSSSSTTTSASTATNDDKEDHCCGGTIESIRIVSNKNEDDENENNDLYSNSKTTYSSIDALLNDNKWKPGMVLSNIVVRNIPTIRKVVTLPELLSSIDPDNALRQQANDAGILLNNMNENDDITDEEDENVVVDNDDDDDDDVPIASSINELWRENYRRVEQTPYEVVNDKDDSVPNVKNKKQRMDTNNFIDGYHIIKAYDILNMVQEINHQLDESIVVGNQYIDRTLQSKLNKVLKKYNNITMSIMDSFVSHGGLIIDLLPDEQLGNEKNTTVKVDSTNRNVIHKMWQVVESFFTYHVNNNNNKTNPTTKLPAWQKISNDEIGTIGSNLGFIIPKEYGVEQPMAVLETRYSFNTTTNDITQQLLLPIETYKLFGGEEGIQSMKNAFNMITELCCNTIQIVVGTCTKEICNVQNPIIAMNGARNLVKELVDNGRKLVVPSSAVSNEENRYYRNSVYTMSASTHRMLRYGTYIHESDEEENENDKTCDGSMNSSKNNSKKTEIFGAHTDTTFITAVPVSSVIGLEIFDEAKQLWYRPEHIAYKHYNRTTTTMNDNDSNHLPWYTRYVILFPGEFLQIVSCNEIPAAVHRVIGNTVTETDSISNTNDKVRYSAPVLLRGRSGMKFDIERYFGIKVQKQQEEKLDWDDNDNEYSYNEDDIWPVWIECNEMTMEQIDAAFQGRPN